MTDIMYLDGQIPVIVMEENLETRNTKVFNEDTGVWKWVHSSRLTAEHDTQMPIDAAQDADLTTEEAQE